MKMTRRQLLSAGGALGAAGTTLLVGGRLAGRPPLAWSAGRAAAMPPPSPEQLLLSRATYGPTRETRARIASLGARAWVEEQLDPASLDDRAVEDALASLESLTWDAPRIKENGFMGPVPVANQLVAATLYRAVASRRQLLEVMVDLWSNHFNVFHPEEFVSRVKTVEDREVIRAHALGSFRALAHASAASPAMMRYLNTVRNRKGGPNENYAREMMELHLLGVEGGYTEQDVKEAARCFTGWNYSGDTWRFEFRPGDHDGGEKTVLGQRIRSGGVDEGHELIDHLVDQPACARHVARRLVTRFVDDEPPRALVDRTAAAFGRDGDIRAMLRVVLTSPELAAAASREGGLVPAKVRRPFEHWAAILRATEVDARALLTDLPPDAYEEGGVDYGERAEGYLQRMDHLPFRWPAPDGYPEAGPWWSGMHAMVGRWNFAMALATGMLPGIAFDAVALQRGEGVPPEAEAIVAHWSDRLLGRPMRPEDRERLVRYVGQGRSGPLPEAELARRVPVLIALLFDSPYFTWR